jgi:hypothetical protein
MMTREATLQMQFIPLPRTRRAVHLWLQQARAVRWKRLNSLLFAAKGASATRCNRFRPAIETKKSSFVEESFPS